MSTLHKTRLAAELRNPNVFRPAHDGVPLAAWDLQDYGWYDTASEIGECRLWVERVMDVEHRLWVVWLSPSGAHQQRHVACRGTERHVTTLGLSEEVPAWRRRAYQVLLDRRHTHDPKA